MKTKVFLLTGILTFLMGCDSNNDITPNQERKESPSVYDVQISECLNKSFEDWGDRPKQGQKYERVEIYTNTGMVKFTHHNTILNCGAEIKIEVDIKGDTIFIMESDTAEVSARCECPYSISYIIELENYGVYHIKLNDEKLFDFTFKEDRYSDTTILLRPYEGPDFYEMLPIWEFYGQYINFTVTDSKGNDLLNPEYSGNILKNDIAITYDNQTFKNSDIKLRVDVLKPLAIRESYSQNLKKHLLTFGEFEPSGKSKNKTFTIDWGDGTSDVVKFDLYVEWPNMYTPIVHEKLYLNEEEVTIEDNGFLIKLIK